MNSPSCIKKRGLLFLVVLLLGAIVGSVATSVATNYMRSTVRRGMPFLLVGKGAESYDNGDTLEALLLITKAALLDPDWYAPYLQLGQVYQKEGCSGLALLYYREAKRLMETLGTEENPGIDHDRSLTDRGIEAILKEMGNSMGNSGDSILNSSLRAAAHAPPGSLLLLGDAIETSLPFQEQLISHNGGGRIDLIVEGVDCQKLEFLNRRTAH